MGDSFKQVDNCERNQSRSESSSSNLVGDMMVCQSALDIFKANSTVKDKCFPDADVLLAQLSEGQKDKVCHAPTHEKFGPVDAIRDEYGDVFELKTSKGNTMTKNTDGSWTYTYGEPGDPGAVQEKVTNVQFDTAGNISYDVSHPPVHIKEGDDGSYAVTSADGTRVYDKDFRIIELPAGEGHSRKFHRDENGHIDQIDGLLGHWDRIEKDGKVAWANKDNGSVWQGEFTISGKDNSLEFRGDDGRSWDFTVGGKDVHRPDHAPTAAQIAAEQEQNK